MYYKNIKYIEFLFDIDIKSYIRNNVTENRTDIMCDSCSKYLRHSVFGILSVSLVLKRYDTLMLGEGERK